MSANQHIRRELNKFVFVCLL